MNVECQCCQKVFNKHNNQIKKTKGNYCSKSCAAKINNRITPKRKKTGVCIDCKVSITTSHSRCSICRDKNKKLYSNSKTRADLESPKSSGRLANKYCRLRQNARLVAKKAGLLEKPCAKCGYNKYVEICHIKSIKDFEDTDLICDINNINNLIQLCPNCHWELDNGGGQTQTDTSFDTIL